MRKTTAVPVLVPIDSTLAYTADSGWHLLPMPPSWWVDERLADNLDDDPIPYLPGDPELDAPIPLWPAELDEADVPLDSTVTVDLSRHDQRAAVAR